MDQVTLHIRNHGHVPSFKNNKMLTRGKLITNPRLQKQMDAITRDLRFQLISLFQTIGDEMQTGRSQDCLTLLRTHSTKFDDSVQSIPRITINVRKVEKGHEGADIHTRVIQPHIES